MNPIVRYSALAALGVAVLAQPALAWHHRHYSHHHRHYAWSHHRHHAATHRRHYAGYYHRHYAWDYRRHSHHAEHAAVASGRHAGLDGMIEKHAAANGVPVSLVHRVIKRESGYNPGAIYAGNYGLMQIRLGTARSLGYRGTAEGLLDPETNMTYAVRYLAGAYHAAGGNESRAVALYASGYGGGGKATARRSPVYTSALWSLLGLTPSGTHAHRVARGTL